MARCRVGEDVAVQDDHEAVPRSARTHFRIRSPSPGCGSPSLRAEPSISARPRIRLRLALAPLGPNFRIRSPRLRLRLALARSTPFHVSVASPPAAAPLAPLGPISVSARLAFAAAAPRSARTHFRIRSPAFGCGSPSLRSDPFPYPLASPSAAARPSGRWRSARRLPSRADPSPRRSGAGRPTRPHRPWHGAPPPPCRSRTARRR